MEGERVRERERYGEEMGLEERMRESGRVNSI